VGGVQLDQIQLTLAALQNSIVGDLAPLVVAGPGDDLAVDGAGQVIRGAQIVGHGDQIAGGIVAIGNFLSIIIVNGSHQIKGVIGVLGGVAVMIGFGHQVSVAVVGEDGDVAQSVHLLGHKTAAVELVQTMNTLNL